MADKLKTKEGVILLGDGDVAVGNVLTAGLLKKQNCCIVSKVITWKKFDQYKAMVENGDAINFMGHIQTAEMVGMEANRENIQADYGSKIVVTQYDGRRLHEGATELPKGAALVPMEWDILKIPKWIVALIKIYNRWF